MFELCLVSYIQSVLEMDIDKILFLPLLLLIMHIGLILYQNS